jgi:hypothetical protein
LGGRLAEDRRLFAVKPQAILINNAREKSKTFNVKISGETAGQAKVSETTFLRKSMFRPTSIDSFGGALDCKQVDLLLLNACQLRSDNLPTTLPLRVSVVVAHLHRPHLPDALNSLNITPRKNHRVACDAGLHVFGRKFRRRATRIFGGFELR